MQYRLSYTMRLSSCVWAIGLLAGVSVAGAQDPNNPCAGALRTTSRIVIKTFDSLRVCILAEEVDSLAGEGPTIWVKASPRFALETRTARDFRRMVVMRDSTIWTIDNVRRPVDNLAAAWRSALLDVLQPAWEAEDLRGRVTMLRAQKTSAIEKSKHLTAEIERVEREARQIGAEISRLRTLDRSTQRDVSSMTARVNQLNQSLGQARQRAAAARTEQERSRYEAEVRQLESTLSNEESRLRALERQQLTLESDRRISALELRLNGLRPEHTLTMLRLELQNNDPESIAAAIEADIRTLDADNRLKSLDTDVERAVAKLRALLPP